MRDFRSAVSGHDTPEQIVPETTSGSTAIGADKRARRSNGRSPDRAGRGPSRGPRRAAGSRASADADPVAGRVARAIYARPMSSASETAALVALLRSAKRPVAEYADLVEDAGGATTILDDEQGLLAPQLLEVRRGRDCRLAGDRNPGPQCPRPGLSREPSRPSTTAPRSSFVAGKLESRDARSVAVIGTRRPSSAGLDRARAVAEHLVGCGFTVASGLAAGIDTAAHTAALARGGRTIAVIGTGLHRSYPPQNAALQRRIATEGAVISQFWPDAPPSRTSFPQRNAVMSGIALATIVIEASHTSGARTQARHALAHGRPVLLMDSLLGPALGARAGGPSRHVVSVPPTRFRRSPNDCRRRTRSSSDAPMPTVRELTALYENFMLAPRTWTERLRHVLQPHRRLRPLLRVRQPPERARRRRPDFLQRRARAATPRAGQLQAPDRRGRPAARGPAGGGAVAVPRCSTRVASATRRRASRHSRS